MVKVGRSKSNQSVDSLPKNSRRCKSVRMFASQENVPTEENGTVLIRFDRRNTEFLNKVRVSTASGELRKLLLTATCFELLLCGRQHSRERTCLLDYGSDCTAIPLDCYTTKEKQANQVAIQVVVFVIQGTRHFESPFK